MTTATRLALAPDCIIPDAHGEGDGRMVLRRKGTPHSMPCPYGTLPVAVRRSRSEWKLDEDGRMLALRYAITIIGGGKCALRIP